MQMSRTTTPTQRPPIGADTSVAEEVDSFRNQIPTSAPPLQRLDDDNARRVSWLHSNALEKATKQNRVSELAMDNTIHELVGSKEDARSDTRGGPAYPERRNAPEEAARSKATMAAHTSSDSLVSRSFLDETNADLSLINTEPHPAGVILQRSG